MAPEILPKVPEILPKKRPNAPRPGVKPLPGIEPRYGNAFRCVGGACEDTCCTGMAVPVDKKTYDKYQKMREGPLRELVRKHVERDMVNATESLFAIINVTPAGACGFLTSERLCGVQKQLGASYLSASCSIYPRALNNVNGKLEASLYLSCPEAARQVLLDPGFMREQGDRTTSAYRKDQFSRLAKNRDGAVYKPYAYFDEVRAVVMKILFDARRPMWQRLFLLGMLCKQLDAVRAAKQNQQVPALLSEYLVAIATGGLRDEMEFLPAQTALQLDVTVQLANLCVRNGKTGMRFRECFQVFLQGIGVGPAATATNTLELYLHAEARYCRPLLEKHPYLLENYLQNYVFRTLFPFGREASAHYTPQSILGEFMQLAMQFTMLNTMLIGMAGHLKAKFDLNQVVKLVQSFSKSIEHDPGFLMQMRACIAERDLANDAGIAALLRA